MVEINNDLRECENKENSGQEIRVSSGFWLFPQSHLSAISIDISLISLEFLRGYLYTFSSRESSHLRFLIDFTLILYLIFVRVHDAI